MHALVALPLILRLAGASDPADLARYIAQIRADGASETAQSSLETVAAILVGETLLEVSIEDDGSVGRSYSSTACPPPNASQAQLAAFEEEQDRKVQPVMQRLRRLADTDRSGFVSTAEGLKFRRDFETGFEIAALAKKDGIDSARLRDLLHMDDAALRTSIARYRQLVAELDGVPNLTIPAIPASLVSPSEKPAAS
jgi:hypothetical protein